MGILLDTNVLLWYVHGDNRLKSSYYEIIDNPSSNVYVSAASIWEIAIKYSLGQLELLPDIDRFLDTHVLNGAYKVLPVSTLHAKYVSRLPFYHRDPFDRLIYAQSVVSKMEFLYTDEIFNKYRGL
ncbi:MAG: PilT protein domain protein [Candidatus Brocadiaceae bacterium]|nr:PilT protein domain protein [Candidatus Brocadiaceae bacterium]